MRKATLLTFSALLLVPGTALAKGGIEFDSYPDTADVGQKISFTVMAMKDPVDMNAEPKAMAGRRPLVTFRSESGKVIRVRTSKTDLNGIGYGSVTFTDRGPWTTEMRVGDMYIPPEQSEPIRVGVGLTETIPAANASKPKPAQPAPAPTTDGSELPWLWIVAFGAMGSAVVLFTMRRRGRWGAA